jgi:predicted PurR-regulated permease PerM
MAYRRFQTYFFIALLTASLIVTLMMFGPFLKLLAFGGVLAVACQPLYRRLFKFFKSETAASGITVVGIGAVVLVPLVAFVATLYFEAVDVLTAAGSELSQGLSSALLNKYLPDSVVPTVMSFLSDSQSVVKAVAGYLSNNLPSIFSNVMSAALGFFIVLFSTYYLLKDGQRLRAAVIALSPLGKEDDETVIARVMTTVRAVINGVVIVGVIKAALAAMFFWIFGVPQPFFWGAIAGVASIIPMVGTSLVTVPAAIFLFITGHVPAAVGLAAVSVGIIGTIDNILTPKLVESKANIHPLLVLLSVLGGFRFFGFAGFVLGPLTLAVTLALIDIYKKEFREIVEE